MADEVKYGLSPEGFKRKRLPEIIDSLVQRTNDRLGISIQTGANSIFGQLYGIIGYELADIWEQTENVYYAMYPNTATGTSLTNAAALTAITPIEAEQTEVICLCTGTDQTLIPSNSQIQDRDSNTYTNNDDVYIDKNNASEIEITIESVVSGTTYTLVINSQTQEYTAKSDDNVTAVLTALYSGFSFEDINFDLTNNVLTISAADEEKTMKVSVNNLKIQSVATPVSFYCNTYGAVNPGMGTVDTINTAINGWDSVSNIKNIVGRDAETDTELRQRWSQSVYARASNMIEAIQANVYRRVDGVISCLVTENNTDTTNDDGLLPHSIKVIVEGGDEQEIAETIYQYSCRGIDFNGEVEKSVRDSAGVTHTIKFARPIAVKIWLKIEITKDTETEWGNNNASEIKELVLEQANSIIVGQDVILQKFIGTLYNNIQGIAFVDITACSGETAGSYEQDNIIIEPTEKASFDLSRIEVQIND